VRDDAPDQVPVVHSESILPKLGALTTGSRSPDRKP
jgi:hypothetical protein